MRVAARDAIPSPYGRVWLAVHDVCDDGAPPCSSSWMPGAEPLGLLRRAAGCAQLAHPSVMPAPPPRAREAILVCELRHGAPQRMRLNPTAPPRSVAWLSSVGDDTEIGDFR